MNISKTIAALLTAALIGLLSFSSAHAMQQVKSPTVIANSHIIKVDHHGSCYKYRWYRGHKYCYRYRYKHCYRWKHDSYGDKYCTKWVWRYYYGKRPSYRGSHSGGYDY